MSAPHAALSGGFAEPAPMSARAFRAVLAAMSRPGTIQRAEGAAPPAPVAPAMGLVALTLCDRETPLWLSPALAATELPDWLRFHCGAPIVADRAAAMFAFGAAEDLLPADGWPMGDAEYPDRGVTLVAEVPDFSGEALRLTGPGIETEQTLPLGPACGSVRALTAMNRALFPLGLDLILCAGTRLAAIPRTTRLQEG